MILKFCSELEEKSHKINTRKFPKTQQKEVFTRFGNQQNKININGLEFTKCKQYSSKSIIRVRKDRAGMKKYPSSPGPLLA